RPHRLDDPRLGLVLGLLGEVDPRLRPRLGLVAPDQDLVVQRPDLVLHAAALRLGGRGRSRSLSHFRYSSVSQRRLNRVANFRCALPPPSHRITISSSHAPRPPIL